MASEVMDSEDGGPAVTPEEAAGHAPAPPVVHLDRGPGEEPAGTGPRSLRSRVVDALAAPTDRRATFRLAAAVVVSGIIGGLVGATVANDRATADAQAVRRGTLAVVADAVDVTVPDNQEGVALVVLRVTNLGPLPVDLVAAPAGSRPAPGRPVVPSDQATSIGAAGRSTRVVLTASLDCSSSAAANPRLPVRTADGVQHQVPIRSLPSSGRGIGRFWC